MNIILLRWCVVFELAGSCDNAAIRSAKGQEMTAAFPEIGTILYEGREARHPLAFRHYNPDEIVAGKTMRDQLRFSIVYWHTFRNPLSDPFGAGTAVRPWDDGSATVKNAIRRVRVAFEFMEKLALRSTPFTIEMFTRNSIRCGKRTPPSMP